MYELFNIGPPISCIPESDEFYPPSVWCLTYLMNQARLFVLLYLSLMSYLNLFSAKQSYISLSANPNPFAPSILPKNFSQKNIIRWTIRATYLIHHIQRLRKTTLFKFQTLKFSSFRGLEIQVFINYRIFFYLWILLSTMGHFCVHKTALDVQEI